MLYINDLHIRELGINWNKTIGVITDSITALDKKDFSQPIKPYLRFKDLRNRIIAMPAYIGNDINMAGIKWIASFPDNIKNGINRAHSVTILNDPQTGVPLCVINTSYISSIRTASVSAYIIKKFLFGKSGNLNIGISGLGPIGQLHLKMVESMLGKRINEVLLYDKNPQLEIDFLNNHASKISIVDSWEQAYSNADIFITSTVSTTPYIDKPPKKGSLHLNVSLRDYKSQFRKYVDYVIVDDWDEVCRENTDIENMHREMALTREETYSIIEVEKNDLFKKILKNDVIMFNPMGMAIFDIGIGNYYYKEALLKNIGNFLEG